jgi:hypothetical protein
MSATASEQIEAMAESLQDIEAQLIEASADPAEFAKLSARRDATRRELLRLEYSQKREASEDGQRHMQALRDKHADSIARGAELYARAGQLDLEIGALTVKLLDLLREADEVTMANNRAVRANDVAAIELTRRGERTQPKVGSWECPSEAVSLQREPAASAPHRRADVRLIRRGMSADATRAHRKCYPMPHRCQGACTPGGLVTDG